MEVYRNNNGEILEVSKLPNGRIKLSQVRNAGRRESKSVGTVKELNAFLYNKGFHLAMTDRSRQFAHNFIEAGEMDELKSLLPNSELAFRKDGDIFTGWFLAFKSDGLVELMSNTDFSYTNELGYKAVTVRIDELILIKGDI